MLDLLLEHGVNHIDTAPSYGDSELRIGPWMDRHRGDFFLATKTRLRDYEGARAEIRRSLERLRTDRIDLLQLHALTHPDEWDRALSPGGALDAAVEAREQGLVRFIGVTGHGWTVAAMHRRSLERFDFDAVLMPWNWFAAQHETYAADFEATVALCERRRVAVQTIKALARGPGRPGRSRTAPPGTSPWRARRTSASRSAGFWRAPGSSSTRSATSTSCPPFSRRPMRWATSPAGGS